MRVVSSSSAAELPGPSGDEEFTGFVIDHYNGLRAYLITAFDLCYHDADAITNDSFFAVREHWSKVRHLEKPKGYLYKVAVRRAGRLKKKLATQYSGDPDDYLRGLPGPGDSAADAGLRDQALAELRQLPPRQRQVFVLRGMGFSEAETADILSVSPGTVKSQLHDARARIADIENKAVEDEWRSEPR